MSNAPIWVLLLNPFISGAAGVLGALIAVWRTNRATEFRTLTARRDAWKQDRRAASARVAASAQRTCILARQYALQGTVAQIREPALAAVRLELSEASWTLALDVAALRLIEDPSSHAAQLQRLESASAQIQDIVRRAELIARAANTDTHQTDPSDIAQLRECAASISATTVEFSNRMRRLLIPEGVQT